MRMSTHEQTHGPRPFVFVAIPFQDDFNDVYRSSIQPAAQAAGAYAERVDESHYDGAIIDRICNQINKCDFMIADVSGKNANVCYEIGYAHAIGKLVILITQSIGDIPFDLCHRPHVSYSRSRLYHLAQDLRPKIEWAISQLKDIARASEMSKVSVCIQPINNNLDASQLGPSSRHPAILAKMSSKGPTAHFRLAIDNDSTIDLPSVSHWYLYAHNDVKPLACTVHATRIMIEATGRKRSISGTELNEYRMGIRTDPVPAGGCDVREVIISFEGPWVGMRQFILRGLGNGSQLEATMVIAWS